MPNAIPQVCPFLETYPTLASVQELNISPWFLKWTEAHTTDVPELQLAARQLPLTDWLYLREQLLPLAGGATFLNAISGLLSLAHQGKPLDDAQQQIAEMNQAIQKVLRLMNLGLQAKDFWNKDGKFHGAISILEKVADSDPDYVANCTICERKIRAGSESGLCSICFDTETMVRLKTENQVLKQRVAYLEWLTGSDHGISSETILEALTGIKSGKQFSTRFPGDFGDFGKCHRLLQLFPELKPRLQEVATKYPEWQPYVDNWEKLTNLYLENPQRRGCVSDFFSKAGNP